MIRYFDVDSKQIRVREILTDKSFLEIEIYAISNANPNRNKSHFTSSSMKKGLKTFNDKPILGFFNSQNDFESHNGKVAQDPELNIEYWDNSGGEQILGFIRQSDQKEIVERDDGLLWIRCTAMICTQYNYKQVKRLLKDRKKKVSVEVSILESEVIDGIENIYDFELMGITILGSRNGVPIKEGIEGAHLSVLDLFDDIKYENQKQALVFAYSQLEETSKKKEDINLAEFEEGKALRVDKSKEAMSDTPWGEVDKTELRQRVVAASNFKEVAKDVFLDLREGWEDGEVTKLKYPVMQIVDGDKLVYNRGALGSAKAYAEKNGEDKVLSKLKDIYEHLGLDSDSEKYGCDGDCEDYEDLKCKEPGNTDDKGDEGNGADGDNGHEDNVNTNEGNTEQNACEPKVEVECGKVYTEEEYSTILNECDNLKMKCHEIEEKYNELACKYSEIEEANKQFAEKIEEYKKMEKELEEAKGKLESIRINGLKDYVDEIGSKYNLKLDEINKFKEDCCGGKYSCNEDIDHDIAYLLFTKNQVKLVRDDEHYSVGINTQTNTSKVDSSKSRATIIERLKSNI